MKKDLDPIQLDIQTLGYYLDRALCVMIKRLNKELKEENLKFQHSDFTVLKVLSETDGLNQSHLARILGKEKSGIGKTLKSLEKEGYIQRSALNGCTNTVRLTEKGKEVLPLLNKIADRVTDIAFAGFSPKKRIEVMNYLTLIYRNAL
ncbi:MAG: MarR family transcriptional regulator [Muribaculaceae bacterium]|nr:MarR family transcriptional regulator [Muribaculaceae bacterium]